MYANSIIDAKMRVNPLQPGYIKITLFICKMQFFITSG